RRARAQGPGRQNHVRTGRRGLCPHSCALLSWPDRYAGIRLCRRATRRADQGAGPTGPGDPHRDAGPRQPHGACERARGVDTCADRIRYGRWLAMSVCLVLPLKSLRGGKTRLQAVLREEERAALIQQLLAHTLGEAARFPGVEHTVLVSACEEARTRART